jgi:hypothetical protein
MPVYRVAITLVIGLALASCSTEPAPAPPPVRTTAPPVPLSQEQYQAALTALDKALLPPVEAVNSAGSFEAAEAARAGLEQAVKAQISALADLTPPTADKAAHTELIRVLSSADVSLRIQKVTSEPAKPNECGVPVDRLPSAKNNVTALLRSTADAATVLQKAGYQVGAFVTPALPTEPPQADRRAANGKIIQRSGPRGRGRLEITNGADADFAVSVVTNGDPKNSQVTIYVHAGAKATITGISGTYEVFFKTGKDWDDARRSFTRGCSYEKFEQPFDQSSNWRIGLEKSTAGNARTDDVPPF